MSSNPENIAKIKEFCLIWQERDLPGILKFFTEDAIYDNVPMEPPLSGHLAIRAGLAQFLDMAALIEFNLLAIAATDDGRVLTERVDRFFVGEKWVEIEVMGIFELRDGLISLWRDYWDLAAFQAQLPVPG